MSKVVPKIYSTKSCNPSNYISSNVTYISRSSNVDFIKDNIFKKDTMSALADGYKVYIGKNSLMPRWKLKKFFHEHKLQKTKLPHLADVALINKKDTINMVDDFASRVKKLYFIPKEEIQNTIILQQLEDEDGIIASSITPGLNKLLLLKNNITFYTKIDVIEIRSTGKHKVKDIFENLFEIAYNQTIKLMYDEDILEQLNSEGHELDEDNMEYMNNMIQSSDQDNVKLALEILSNVNYEKSYIKVSNIISVNWRTINNSKELWNPNFKSLMMYLGTKEIALDDGWKSLIKSLLLRSKDNPTRIKEIEGLIKNNLNQELKKVGISITNLETNFS